MGDVFVYHRPQGLDGLGPIEALQRRPNAANLGAAAPLDHGHMLNAVGVEVADRRRVLFEHKDPRRFDVRRQMGKINIRADDRPDKRAYGVADVPLETIDCLDDLRLAEQVMHRLGQPR